MDVAFLVENVTLLAVPTNSTTHLKRIRKAPCEDYSDIRKSMQNLSLFFYSLAFLLGVTGNALVIRIMGFKMKKTVNVVWFLNLSIADLIFTFFLPLNIASTAMDYHWPFGMALWKMHSMVLILNMYSSIFFLVVISIDRCVSVIYPVWSQNHRTPRLSSIIAMVTWALALAISSPALAFRDTLTRKNSTYCYNNYAFSTKYTDPQIMSLATMRKTAMALTTFVCGFLLPFIVILVCYGVITHRLRRSQFSRTNKPFRIMIAVVVSSFLCWLPTRVFALLEIGIHQKTCLMQRVFKVSSPVISSLAYFSSCINPIIYVFMGRDFKEKFRTSILSVLERAFSEDSAVPQTRTSLHLDERKNNMLLETR